MPGLSQRTEVCHEVCSKVQRDQQLPFKHGDHRSVKSRIGFFHGVHQSCEQLCRGRERLGIDNLAIPNDANLGIEHFDLQAIWSFFRTTSLLVSKTKSLPLSCGFVIFRSTLPGVSFTG